VVATLPALVRKLNPAYERSPLELCANQFGRQRDFRHRGV
jgi:hypothetical protein